jgi:deoxyribodipyrimidine photolyase-related protein
VLVEDGGKPVAGRWNYDQDNRKPWRGQPPVPADSRERHDHTALWRTIIAAGVGSFGKPEASQLAWPLNRAEALRHLGQFIELGLYFTRPSFQFLRTVGTSVSSTFAYCF